MSLRHPVCILTYIHAFIRVCICYVGLQCTEDRSDWLHHSSKSLKADIANTIQRVYLYGCVCEDRFDWLRLSSKSDFPRKMLHSQNTPIRVTQIPQYLAVQIQIKMLSYLNLYWAIWVSWHGGFWGCSILKSVVFWVESVIRHGVTVFSIPLKGKMKVPTSIRIYSDICAKYKNICHYRVAKSHRMPYKLQDICRKRAINYRALLRKMTYEDKASYDSAPHCTHTLTFVHVVYSYKCICHILVPLYMIYTHILSQKNMSYTLIFGYDIHSYICVYHILWQM